MSDRDPGPFSLDAEFGEEALRRLLARQCIESGRLPARLPSRVWGGRGSGETCTVCSRVITPQQLGFELEFAEDGRKQGIHFLHAPCQAAWEAEWRNGTAIGRAGEPDEAAPENRNADGDQREPGA